MAALDRERILAEERTVPGAPSADLSGGALGHSVPTGIEVASGAWMRKAGIGTALLVAVCAAMGLFFGWLVVLGVVEVSADDVPMSMFVAGELMFGSLAALGLAGAVRMARAGLRISPGGVHLRGIFRTRVLPLVEVERFAPGVFSSGLARSEIGVTVVRHQGRNFPVWALRGGAPSSKDGLQAAFAAMQPLCDELNELLGEMRGDSVKESQEVAGAESITRAEAEKAFRTVRGYLIGAAIWFLAIAAVATALDFGGWQIYLPIVVLTQGIGSPLFLRFYRRELDEKVRTSEAAAGKR